MVISSMRCGREKQDVGLSESVDVWNLRKCGSGAECAVEGNALPHICMFHWENR